MASLRPSSSIISNVNSKSNKYGKKPSHLYKKRSRFSENELRALRHWALKTQLRALLAWRKRTSSTFVYIQRQQQRKMQRKRCHQNSENKENIPQKTLKKNNTHTNDCASEDKSVNNSAETQTKVKSKLNKRKSRKRTQLIHRYRCLRLLRSTMTKWCVHARQIRRKRYTEALANAFNRRLLIGKSIGLWKRRTATARQGNRNAKGSNLNPLVPAIRMRRALLNAYFKTACRNTFTLLYSAVREHRHICVAEHHLRTRKICFVFGVLRRRVRISKRRAAATEYLASFSRSQRLSFALSRWCSFVSEAQSTRATEAAAIHHCNRSITRRALMSWAIAILLIRSVRARATKMLLQHQTRMKSGTFIAWNQAAKAERHARQRRLCLFTCEWHRIASERAAARRRLDALVADLRDELLLGKLSRAFAAWVEASRRAQVIRISLAFAQGRRELSLLRRSLSAWRAFTGATRHHSFAALRRSFGGWRYLHDRLCHLKAQRRMALRFWGKTLTRRTFSAWMESLFRAKREKEREAAAIQWRRRSLLRRGTRAWLSTAFRMTAARVSAVKRIRLRRTEKAMDCMTRAIQTWRQRRHRENIAADALSSKLPYYFRLPVPFPPQPPLPQHEQEQQQQQYQQSYLHHHTTSESMVQLPRTSPCPGVRPSSFPNSNSPGYLASPAPSAYLSSSSYSSSSSSSSCGSLLGSPSVREEMTTSSLSTSSSSSSSSLISSQMQQRHEYEHEQQQEQGLQCSRRLLPYSSPTGTVCSRSTFSPSPLPAAASTSPSRYPFLPVHHHRRQQPPPQRLQQYQERGEEERLNAPTDGQGKNYEFKARYRPPPRRPFDILLSS